MLQTGEPVFIQALIPKPPIERFEVRVLVGLQNSLPLSVLIALGRPLVLASCSRIRTSWLPRSAHSGTMATAPWVASSTTVRLLMLRPSAMRAKHEVHGPRQVGCCWVLQRMPGTQRDFIASALLHLQPSLGIQAIHALVVHKLTRLAQLQIDHAGAV